MAIGVGYAVKRASISVASAGDNTAVAAVAATKIRVYGLWLWSLSANTVILKSGANVLNGAGYNLPAGGQWSFEPCAEAPLELGLNEALVLNLSAATNVSGIVIFTQVLDA
jgi:hypothetical protein